MWCEILINVIGTVIGGLLLAVILFFFNEYVFPICNISGEWNVEELTEKTSYNPYRNMKLFYKFHLLQTGNSITGSGEKIKETLSDKKTFEYERKNRTTSVISGYYERNFLRADKVYINIVENGRQRQTRTSYILKVEKKKSMVGNFLSTIADSSGQINMTKL